MDFLKYICTLWCYGPHSPFQFQPWTNDALQNEFFQFIIRFNTLYPLTEISPVCVLGTSSLPPPFFLSFLLHLIPFPIFRSSSSQCSSSPTLLAPSFLLTICTSHLQHPILTVRTGLLQQLFPVSFHPHSAQKTVTLGKSVLGRGDNMFSFRVKVLIKILCSEVTRSLLCSPIQGLLGNSFVSDSVQI